MWEGMRKSEGEFSGIYQYMLDYSNAKKDEKLLGGMGSF